MKKTSSWSIPVLAILFLSCQLPPDSFIRTVLSQPVSANCWTVLSPSGTSLLQRFPGNKVTYLYYRQPETGHSKVGEILQAESKKNNSSRQLFVFNKIHIPLSTILVR